MVAIVDSSSDLNVHRWNGSQWMGRQEFAISVSTTTGENFMISYRADAEPAATADLAWLVLGEKLKWNYAVSLLCIGLAVYFAFGVNRTPAPAA